VAIRIVIEDPGSVEGLAVALPPSAYFIVPYDRDGRLLL
jgi:hypothetical protein